MTIKKALVSLIAILISIGIYISLIWSGESISRAQNNFNLEVISNCVVERLDEYDYTSNELSKSFDTCAKNMRSLGITGDVFVIRKSDKKLFWDSSVDCRPESGEKLFMTSKGICSLFSEPGTCLASMQTMLDNPPEGSLIWEFDNDIEYIDYRYLEKIDKISGKNIPIIIDNSQYIIGQGTQKDEVQSYFILTYIILVLGTIIITFIINY